MPSLDPRIGTIPRLDALRADPRFKTLMSSHLRTLAPAPWLPRTFAPSHRRTLAPVRSRSFGVVMRSSQNRALLHSPCVGEL